MIPLAQLETTPTHKVVRIFFDFTDLPPDLIGIITGYYNDWLEYEEIEELKNKVLETSRNLGNLWWRTYSSYMNQRYMVTALRIYVAKNNNHLMLSNVYGKTTDITQKGINYRTHVDISKYLDRIYRKTLQYWNKREVEQKNISQNYQFRKRFRQILNKELVNISNLEALFEDVYLMSLEMKMEDPKTTPYGKENCEYALAEIAKKKKEIKQYYRIKKLFETEILETAVMETHERPLFRFLNN
jgi:hypothetical protein